MNELRLKLKELGVCYSESQMINLLESIEIALEDGSDFVYVTNGYEDLELSIKEMSL